MSRRYSGHLKFGNADIINDDRRGLHQFWQTYKNQQHLLGPLESTKGSFTAHQLHGQTMK